MGAQGGGQIAQLIQQNPQLLQMAGGMGGKTNPGFTPGFNPGAPPPIAQLPGTPQGMGMPMLREDMMRSVMSQMAAPNYGAGQQYGQQLQQQRMGQVGPVGYTPQTPAPTIPRFGNSGSPSVGGSAPMNPALLGGMLGGSGLPTNLRRF